MIFSTDSPLFTWGETETFHRCEVTGDWFSEACSLMTLLLGYVLKNQRLAFILASRTNWTKGRFAGQT
jgi:hypothetical protein